MKPVLDRGLKAAGYVVRKSAAIVMAFVAIYMIVLVWDVYILSPWTRDGRVFAQTVTIAPEVSGTVVSVPLIENELVQKGQTLFIIDPSRFQIALAQAQAQLSMATFQLVERKQDQSRRQNLAGLISNEERTNSSLDANIAHAQLDGAQAALDLAKLNLKRSTVYSPVTGYITHLRLQVGNFADAGNPVITVLDGSSFEIVAYYEETKLDRIKVGQSASIKLMGYKERFSGHVISIGRGIGDENGNIDELGLPVVNPVFDWVRLAQRIPVDLSIDNLPAGVTLASGMTCSVDIGKEPSKGNGLNARFRRWLEDSL